MHAVSISRALTIFVRSIITYGIENSQLKKLKARKSNILKKILNLPRMFSEYEYSRLPSSIKLNLIQFLFQANFIP
jgi:hypothetical protein